jgi:hypothetical protein
MKKVLILFSILALFLVACCPKVNAQTNDKVTISASELTSAQLAKVKAQQENTLVFNVKDTLVKSAELTFNKVYEDAKAGIVGLAKALKQPAIHIYNILVKQQIVNSITYLFFFILTIVLTILSINWMRNAKWGDGDTCEEEDCWNINATLGLIFGIISFVLIIVSICNIQNMVMGFVNPEYGAIKDIMNFIK